jgi:hypothetical protein
MEDIAVILELEREDVVVREAELFEDELLDTERLEGITLDATEELIATDETAVGLDLFPPPPPPPPLPPPQPTNSSALPSTNP